MKRLVRWLFRKPENEAFVAFFQVALEDEDIRAQVLSVLALNGAERSVWLAKWRDDLEKENAPPAIIEVVESLQDDQLADKLLEMLNNKVLKSIS